MGWMWPRACARSNGFVRTRLAWVAMLLVLLAASGLEAGCAFFPTPQATIQGHVYGVPYGTASTTSRATTSQQLQPVRATIRCNKAQTTARADGSYSLSMDQADHYACTISAAPNYASEAITISGSAGNKLTLDVGSATGSDLGCASPVTSPTATCAPLQLRPATLAGTVVSADTKQPIAGVSVTCWQPAGTPGAARRPTNQKATTSANGTFALAAVPPGPYACHVAGDVTLYQGTVDPGAQATLSVHLCRQHCPPVTFHEGAVVHELTAYLLFWLPKGHAFEPGGSDTRFETLMGQYMNDIGGSAFYGLLTQYWDYSGSVVNAVHLGATVVDSTPYPHAGTRADPLTSDNIEHEIDAAIARNHWSVDGEHVIFVFTGYNVESCAYSTSGKQCSFASNGKHYCAYHAALSTSHAHGDAIYAYLPVISDCVQLDELSSYGSPNHDAIADATINSLSHEQFEAVTDPYDQGWYDGDPTKGEIADKCEYRFGTIHPGGGNVSLAHGHTYLLQAEWSDRTNGCAFD